MIEVFDGNDAKHFMDEDDFSLSWENVLDTGETIETFTPTVISGEIEIVSSSVVGPVTTARLSGGEVGLSRLRYTILTSEDRVLNAEVYVKIIRGL